MGKKLDFLREVAAKYGYKVNANPWNAIFMTTWMGKAEANGEKVIVVNPFEVEKSSERELEGAVLHEHLHNVFEEKYPNIGRAIDKYIDIFSRRLISEDAGVCLTSIPLDYYNHFFFAKEILSPDELEKFIWRENRGCEKAVARYYSAILNGRELDVVDAGIFTYCLLVTGEYDKYVKIVEKYKPKMIEYMNKFKEILLGIKKPEDILTAFRKINEMLEKKKYVELVSL